MKIHTLLEQPEVAELTDPQVATNHESIADQLIEVVRKARPFMARSEALISTSSFLYRGVLNSLSKVVVYIKPRGNRQPRDTPQYIHELLDKNLQRDFGVPYRSAGVFATSNKDTAALYGDVTVFLPLGQFKYCWGEHVTDATIHFDGMELLDELNKADPELKFKGMDYLDKYHASANVGEFLTTRPDLKPVAEKWFDRLYDDAGYTNEQLIEAIGSGHEVMVKCDEYALVQNTQLDWGVVEAINKKAGTDLNQKQCSTVEVIRGIARSMPRWNRFEDKPNK